MILLLSQVVFKLKGEIVIVHAGDNSSKVSIASYRFRKSYLLTSKRYNLDGVSYNELCELQDGFFKNMTKTKFTNSCQKWTRDDDFCLLWMWNNGTPMIEIERVLNRSEKCR